MGNIRICWPQVLHFFVRLPARSSDRRVAPILPGYWPSLYLFNLEADSRLPGASPIESNGKILPNSATPELLQLLYLTNPQWLENGQ